MKIIKSIFDLNKEIKDYKNIGFVPTMGGIHEGHASLIKASQNKKSKTIVSIYVNPTQFNKKIDFRKYPRNIKKDIISLKKLNVNYLFLPSTKDIYKFKTRKFVLSKKDKIFITDSGLMASILGWPVMDILEDRDKVGKLVESFIFHELSVQIDLEKNRYDLYHYRDREKREIDFIIQRNDGKILAIEVKSGSSISRDSFKHIKWFKNNIVKDQEVIGIVLYTGKDILSFGSNLWAIPIGCLWS